MLSHPLYIKYSSTNILQFLQIFLRRSQLETTFTARGTIKGYYDLTRLCTRNTLIDHARHESWQNRVHVLLELNNEDISTNFVSQRRQHFSSKMISTSDAKDFTTLIVNVVVNSTSKKLQAMWQRDHFKILWN